MSPGDRWEVEGRRWEGSGKVRCRKENFFLFIRLAQFFQLSYSNSMAKRQVLEVQKYKFLVSFVLILGSIIVRNSRFELHYTISLWICKAKVYFTYFSIIHLTPQIIIVCFISSYKIRIINIKIIYNGFVLVFIIIPFYI